MKEDYIKKLTKILDEHFPDDMDNSMFNPNLPPAIEALYQLHIEGVREIIENASPDVVLPIEDFPKREDYINKWKLLEKLKK